MAALAIRPTFTLTTALPPERAIARLAEAIEAAAGQVVLQRVERHMMAAVEPGLRHFWSPWMNVEATLEDGHTRVFARFSPAPSIWTGFMLTYIALLAIALFAGTWAGAQATMGRWPWALWVSAACIAVAGLMWWASRVGQRLAHEQMHGLRETAQAALEDPGDRPQATDAVAKAT